MNPLPLNRLLCRVVALTLLTLRPASPSGAARAVSGDGSDSPRNARLTAWLALSLLALAPLTSHLSAQTVPPLVNYQGRLSNPDGSPLPTADYTLSFNLYDAATNGALVWGPQVFDGAAAQGHGARIPVVMGYFNATLGPVDTAGRALSDAFNGAMRYVEIAVSNRPPILPRQQFLTSPFAFQAAQLAGADWSAVFGTNDPVNGRIPASKLSTTGTITATAFSGNGSALTNLSANNLSSGTVADGRLSGNVMRLDAVQTATGAKTFNGAVSINNSLGVNGTATATAFSGNGSALTSLSANNLSSGTVADGRLSGNVMRLDADQTATGAKTFSGPVSINNNISVTDTINFPAAVGRLAAAGAITIQAGVDQPLYLNPFGGGGLVQVGSIGGSGHLNVAGNQYVAGNLGVGTASPSQKLEVIGRIAASIGYTCRTGSDGNYTANVFNFRWNSPNFGAYVDNSFVGNFTLTSDRRLKSDITPIQSSALERVMGLRPVSFRYKTIPGTIFQGSPEVTEGFIADEVQEVIPSAVTGEKNGLTSDGKIQPQTMNIAPLVAVLTKAVQEQQEFIQKQQNQIQSLETRLVELESMVKSSSARK